MATLSHTESKSMYSWWWGSHISPKNSKWLHENMTDVDTKVKQMIKLIEEDADSFARRAEMYYKKRPELMKLVEEFYRAYRALAERYDHATGALHQAHRTMSEAFPNQVPVIPNDSPTTSTGEPDLHTPEIHHPTRTLFGEETQRHDSGFSSPRLHGFKRSGAFFDDSDSDTSKKGLKQLNEILGSGEKVHGHEIYSGARVRRGPTEEKEKKSHCNSPAKKIDEKNDIQSLKESPGKLDERDDTFALYQRSLERLSLLELNVAPIQKDSRGLNERLGCTESLNYTGIENQTQNKKATVVMDESHDFFKEQKELLGVISELNNKVHHTELECAVAKEDAGKAQKKIESLNKVIADLENEKDASVLQCREYLDKLSTLDDEISSLQAQIQRHCDEYDNGVMKLKHTEEWCLQLEKSNRSLEYEVESLMVKMGTQTEELIEKQHELDGLWKSLQQERLRLMDTESAFQSLQWVYSECQEEIRSLSAEHESDIEVLKEMEEENILLDGEIKKIKAESMTLTETNQSFITSMQKMRDEFCELREEKRLLAEEVRFQDDQKNALSRELFCIQEEKMALNKELGNILGQIESVNLKPDCLGSSIKELLDEKATLVIQLQNFEEMCEKCSLLEKSVLDLNTKLEKLKGNSKELEDICESLRSEKCALSAEKDSVVSELHVAKDDIEKFSEKNIFLDNSLSDAHFEHECLEEKMKGLKGSLEFIGTENLNLIAEKHTLDIQFQKVCQRLEDTEKKYQKMEEEHSCLEKGIEFALGKIEEISVSLDTYQKTSVEFLQSSELRLDCLESNAHLLSETCSVIRNKFDEEVDAHINAQIEGYVLMKCIQDLTENNLTLLVKHDKLAEASMTLEELLSVSQSRNIQQEVEVEYLNDQLKELQMALSGVYGALKMVQYDKHMNKEIPHEKVDFDLILREIANYKKSLLQADDANLHLLVENSIFVTLLQHLKFEASCIEMDNRSIIQKLGIMEEELLLLQKSNFELLQMNEESLPRLWEMELKEGMLLSTGRDITEKLLGSRIDIQKLNDKNFEQTQKISILVNRLNELEEEKFLSEDDSFVVLGELFYSSNLSVIFMSYISEKYGEQKEFLGQLENLCAVNNVLQGSLKMLEEEVEVTTMENLHLKEEFRKSEAELKALVIVRDQLAIEKCFVNQMNLEVLKVKEKLIAADNDKVEWNKIAGDLHQDISKLNVVKGNQDKLIVKLTEDCRIYKKETEYLCDSLSKLNSELRNFQNESENTRFREEKLKADIETRKIEAELWEHESTAILHQSQEFFVREEIYEEKLYYINRILDTISDESRQKDSQIQLLKETLATVQDENGRLRSCGDPYLQALYVQRECVSYLENLPYTTKWQSGLDVDNEMKNKGNYTDSDRTAAIEVLEELQELKTRMIATGEKGSEITAVQEDMVKPLDSNPCVETSRSSHGEEDERTADAWMIQTEHNQVYPLKEGRREEGDQFSGITEQEVAEQGWEGSEKRERLQTEEEEEEMKRLGRGGRRVVLRDYLYGNLRRSGSRSRRGWPWRRRYLCGCVAAKGESD